MEDEKYADTRQPASFRPMLRAKVDKSGVGVQDSSTKERLLHIDGLRGLAILLVLMTHAWVFSGAPALSWRILGHQLVLASVPAVGYVGVNLFLILSGFCLTWPFVRDVSYRNRMSLCRFLGRRVRRIAPAYYISIIVIIVLNVAGAATSATAYVWPTWADIWWHLAFIHNLSLEHASTINGAYWSLALEFQLYLLFPLLYEAMRRWGSARVFGICILAQLIYRISLEHTLSADFLATYDFVLPKALPGRMADFVGGMAVAFGVAHEERKQVHYSAWAPAASALFLGAAFAATYGRYFPQSVIDVMWSFGFAALVWWASNNGLCNRLFCYKPLTYLGIISYSVYLLHQPLIERVCSLIRNHFNPGTAFIATLAALPVVIMVCFVFYLGCEKRFFEWFANLDRKRIARLNANPLKGMLNNRITTRV